MVSLTPAQQRIYEFVRNFIEREGHAPSHEEIRDHFGFKSRNAVHKHLLALQERGYLKLPLPNKKRAMELIQLNSGSVSIPFLGSVAAGTPIEAIEIPETLEVPETLLGRGENFALRVRGESMIDEGIRDGDVLIVTKQPLAEKGAMVIAQIHGEATVKRIFPYGEEVELRPSNSRMAPIRVKAAEVEILGTVVGLLRNYKLANPSRY